MSLKWFAAHVIMYVQYKNASQTTFPVWENIYLVSGETEDEAFEKAARIGRSREGDEEDSFRWGGQDARWVFGGVRKLTSCQNPDERPKDGSELTYLEYLAPSRITLDALINAKEANVVMQDLFAGDDEELGDGAAIELTASEWPAIHRNQTRRSKSNTSTENRPE